MKSTNGFDPDDPEAVPTIAELIQRHRDATGDSYRAMAERAHQQGITLKHQTLADLATKPPKGWPKNPETITGIALALRTTERAIVVAFARSFGLDMTAERELFTNTLYGATGNELRLMPRDVQAQVRELVQEAVETYLDERGGERGGDTPAIATETTPSDELGARRQEATEEQPASDMPRAARRATSAGKARHAELENLGEESQDNDGINPA